MPTDRPQQAPFDTSSLLFPAEWQAISAAFDDSDIGLLFMQDGIITCVNRTLQDRLGFDAAELSGKPVSAILFSENTSGVHPECAAPSTEAVCLVAKNGKPVDFHLLASRFGLPEEAGGMWVLRPAESPLQPSTTADDISAAAAIVEQLPDPVLVCGTQGEIRYASPAFAPFLGNYDDRAGEPNLIELAGPEDRSRLLAAFAQMRDGEDAQLALRLRHRDGRWRQFAGRGRNLLAHREINGLLLTLHDLGEQARQQQRIAADRKRQLHYLNRLLRLSLHPHPHRDSALKVVLKAATKALGAHRCAYWEVDEAQPAVRCILAYDDVQQNLVAETTDALQPLLLQVRLDERALVVDDVAQEPRAAAASDYFHAESVKALMITPVHSGGRVIGLLVISQLIAARTWRNDEAEFASQCAALIALLSGEAERARSDIQQRQQAHQDSLTGLPNRQFLFERAADIFPRLAAKSTSLAAFFIDLDGFKHVNDALGHAIGDELLKAVALRLKNLVRKDDVLARLGGDEFMLLAQNLDDMRVAEDIAQQIIDAMNAPFSLRGHELQVSASIGIALYPFDGNDLDTLMKKADIALFHAKSGGRNRYQMFSPRQASRVSTQSVLEGELRRAVRERELQHYYQPQVDLRTGKVRCVEALLRWHHPRHGLLPPAAFLPLAERSGLIHTITRWAMNDACEQLKSWRAKGLEHIRIAINLAAGQLTDNSLMTTLEEALERTGVMATQLEWEVRESTVMQHDAMSTSLLDRMADLQIGLSIDDFGSGYSNLGYLRRYPVRKVKIDRSLISTLPDEGDGRAVTDAIILMAQPLGLDVVAEGVETQQQMEYLRAHGCHIAQGYYFTEPLTADQFETWLIRH